VNGDTVVGVNVTVTPACVSNYVVPSSMLNWNDSNDLACIASAQQQTGIVGSGGGNSLCANTVWDTQAVATDVLTSAQYVIDEGTAVRVPASTTCP
jgi:hypothetical protein